VQNRLPESLDDVTSEWLSAALRSKGYLRQGAVVVTRVTPIGSDSGFTSQVARIGLAFDYPEKSLPSSMIVKLAAIGSENASSRMFEERYARECSFYSLIWPDVGVRTPACYLAAREAQPSRVVLLLEDLGTARFGDSAAGWSRQDAELVVDALAGLHAKWWNSQKLDEWTWIPPYGDVAAQLEKLGMRRTVFLERYDRDISAELRGLTMLLGPKHADLLQRLGGRPSTLLHVDAHLDNIAFLDGPASTPVLFDWQSVSKGLGVVDLALFLTGSAPEHRRLHERELIERYHGRLATAGITNYSLDVVMADYEVALLRWWIGTVNGLGSPYAAAWTGRQAGLAQQSVRWWNGVAADHPLSSLLEPT